MLLDPKHTFFFFFFSVNDTFVFCFMKVVKFSTALNLVQEADSVPFVSCLAVFCHKETWFSSLSYVNMMLQISMLSSLT
jgi:hypothetical protein